MKTKVNLWAPLDRENFKDPFPMYRELRDSKHPYRASTGEWIVSRYEEIKSILTDRRFTVGNKKKWINKGIQYFQHIEKDFSIIATAIDAFILLIDPPRHTVLRKFTAEAWDNRQVEEIIRSNIKTLIGEWSDGKQADLMRDFARPLPAMTIADILGVSQDDHRMLQGWGFDLVKALDLYNKLEDLVRMDAAADHLVTYFREHIKNDNRGGLIGKIIALNKRKPTLSDNELVSICILLLVAGQETTVGLIGTGLWRLAQYPDQRTKLCSRPELMASGIEELLRYDGPVHMLGRIASEDISIGDQYIGKGEPLTLCLASANRDPRQFDQADNIIVDRDPNPHLAFGAGIHRCLGDWLATHQSRIAIQSILDHFPGYKTGSTQPEWNNNISIRTLKSLPVIL